MVIKLKKRDLFLIHFSILFVLALIAMSSVPLIYGQTSNTTDRTFKIFLTISNRAPSVFLINATGFAVDPLAGGNAQILLSFNGTDPDDVDQINGTDGGIILVNLTLGSGGIGQHRSDASDTCTNVTHGDDAGSSSVIFNCTINMRWYDNSSSDWVINISLTDSNSATVFNDSNAGSVNKFTYNQLASFSFNIRGTERNEGINFSNSVNLGTNNIEANAPMLLNNTGNVDFESINITGNDLVGIDTSSEIIDPSNFFVNATNGSSGNRGQPFIDGEAIVVPGEPIAGSSVPNATLFHGPAISGDSGGDAAPYVGVTDSKGNQTLIFWVNVPSSGLSAQQYNTTWNMTLIQIR